MERRERIEILGDWGVRAENARERRERLALERDLEDSPLVGKPLRSRPSLRPGADSYVTALGGPRHYMVRLREIEGATAEHELVLEGLWHELAARHRGDPAGFASSWREAAARWNFTVVNDLIASHNR